MKEIEKLDLKIQFGKKVYIKNFSSINKAFREIYKIQKKGGVFIGMCKI